MTSSIPFNKPRLCPKDLEYVEEGFRNLHTSGDGPFSRKCQHLLQKFTDRRSVLLTTSGTHALEIAAYLLDLKPGDEVILPSFTFVSTANAFVTRGATPVFVDIRPDTLNLNENKISAQITEKTRAIVPVHYAGVGCEMDAICKLAKEHGIKVIEDNAHGLFGSYRGRPLGSFGDAAIQSFHETKNISCGEGGAILLDDPKWIEEAEIIREKGTNRSQFFRGMVDKYTWRRLGSSYVPSDILSAILLSQLESREEIQRKRLHIWNRYYSELGEWAAANGVRLPIVPDHCEHPAHIFYLLMPTPSDRSLFITHMKQMNINCVFHYVPLHSSPMGKRVGRGQCPVTEQVSDTLVRLPLFPELRDEEVDRVVQGAQQFTAQQHAIRKAG